MTAPAATAPHLRRAAPCGGSRGRGAAFVEAVLVILFMSIVLAGILYFGRYFEARQRALGLARQCAWAYSRNACQEDPSCGEPGHFPCLPPICAELLHIEQVPDQELRNKVADARALVQSSGKGRASVATVDARERFREGVAEQTAQMLELLTGEYVYASGTSTIEGSPALPGAPTELNVNYALPCNLKRKDSLNIAVELFSKLRPARP